jgi:hypothetical protein
MKNIYTPHPLMISSGEFWRCDHGSTGRRGDLRWQGCWRCALRRPLRAFRVMWAQRIPLPWSWLILFFGFNLGLLALAKFWDRVC